MVRVCGRSDDCGRVTDASPLSTQTPLQEKKLFQEQVLGKKEKETNRRDGKDELNRSSPAK